MKAVLTTNTVNNPILVVEAEGESERAFLSLFLNEGTDKSLGVLSSSHACDLRPTLYQAIIGWRQKAKEMK